MELLIKVLIALGSLSSPTEFTDQYKSDNQSEVIEAQSLIDQGRVRETDGGVIIDGVGV